MPVQVTIDVIQAPPMAVVARSYFLVRERYEDLLDPMYESVGLLSQQIKENFESESSGGEKWPDWSFWYKMKRGQGSETFTDPVTGERTRLSFEELVKTGFKQSSEGQKILQLTGALYGVATDVTKWDVDMQGNSAVAVMEDVPSYGFAHIMGADVINLPVRDWSFMPDEVLDEMDQKFFDHFDEPME